MNTLYKYFIFIGFIFTLSFSWLHEYFPVIIQEPLNGAFETPDTTNITISNWIDESFQESISKRNQFNHPLRSALVRLRNQIDYSLFNIAHFYDVLIGENNYIYSEAWAKTGAGQLNKSLDFYKDSIGIFKIFQNYKKNQGGTFFIMIAPSKERLYSEFLPLEYRKDTITDYDLLTTSLDENKVNYIDFVKRFKSIQDTIKYPLYGKASTHWTKFGAHLAMIEMFDSLESQCNFKLPYWGVSNISEQWPTPEDKDIEQTMNLLFAFDQKMFAYPSYEFDPKIDSLKKPKIIVISDSFYWGILGSYVPLQVFSSTSSFWYYFKTNFENIREASLPLDQVDILKEIKTADAVLMMVGSENMDEFPFGFGQFLEKNKTKFLTK